MPVAKLNIYDTRVDISQFMALPVVADYGYSEEFSIAGIGHTTMDNREIITTQQISPSMIMYFHGEMLFRTEYRPLYDAIASRKVSKFVSPILSLCAQTGAVWATTTGNNYINDGGVGHTAVYSDLEESDQYRILTGTVASNPYTLWAKCFTANDNEIYECDSYALYHSATGDYHVYEVGFDPGDNITSTSGSFKLIYKDGDEFVASLPTLSAKGEIYLCPILKGLVTQNLSSTRYIGGVASHDLTLSGVRFGIVRGEYGL